MAIEIGFIGAGNMAEAIARGLISRGVFGPAQIMASDVAQQRRDLFQGELGIRCTPDNRDIARQAKTLVLSVKPQQMQSALLGIGEVLDRSALVISIAAGISSGFIEKNLGGGGSWHVIRTMPNTPMLVGEGMVAMASGSHSTADDMARARRIFEACATVIDVPESKIDAVTALSGSGPAYFFFLVEQMIRAGEQMGLTAAEAHTLSAKTALGAAKMLCGSTDSPQELRRKVTSPGGTTHAAITHMESQQMPNIVVDALKAAAARSAELGQ